MGFTVVPDKASGDILSESNWDTHIRDNFNTGVPVVLANSTLGGSAASIDLTGISQSWAHLMLVCYLRGDTAATSTPLGLRFNADTGANYDLQNSQGQAAVAGASESFAQTSAAAASISAASATANVFTALTLHIPYYSQGTNNKTLTTAAALKYGTATTNLIVYNRAAFWRSNSAITQITLTPGAGNLVSGSRATLYGMP